MKKTTTMMKTIRLIFLALVVGQLCPAQELTPNTKFGKPTDQELNLTTYAAEPNAPALQLCRMTDVAYDMFNGELKLIITEKVKIKILTEEGKEYADIQVPYLATDIVGNIKATTYNIENGKQVKTKMANDQIFRKKVDENNMLLSFSIPQVKAGSVIEYQYRIERESYGNINTWYAQRSIPVLYAQYDLVIPEWLKFKVEESGTHPFEKKVGNTSVTFHVKGNELNLSGMQYRFVGQRLPSLKDDDFVWSIADYCNKVTCELGGIFIPGSVYKNFSQTWQGIDNQLWDDEDFGGRLLQENPFKNEMTQAGIATMSNIKDKARAILQLLQEKVKWNGKYALWGKAANTVLKEGSGNNADLNFILISMLKDAGLTAMPVVLRTRDSGRIPLTHPSLRFMNTFIVGVQDKGDEIFFLDASASYGDVNMLPSLLLVEKGRVMRKGTGSSWTDVQTIANGKTTTDIHATLTEDGLLTGKAVSKYEGNDAYAKRRAYNQAEDSAAYVKKFAEKHNIDISTYQLEGAKAYTPTATQTMDFSQQANATTDIIYLNPVILPLIKEAPLTAEKRALPIEFPYKDIDRTNIYIKLPANYHIETLPGATHVADKDGKLTYSLTFKQEEQTLIIQQTFSVDQLFFQPSSYESIKKVFDTMVEKSQMMIVLKK